VPLHPGDSVDVDLDPRWLVLPNVMLEVDV